MDEFSGKITALFKKEALEKLCSNHIQGYDASRFEIVAMRLFSGKELVLTFYAADKLNESSTIPPGRFPVKKFKLNIVSPQMLYDVFESYNFTISNPGYNMDDMEVMNR